MIYFISCILVLCFIAFAIRKAVSSDEIRQQPPEDQKSPEEEKDDFPLPLIK